MNLQADADGKKLEIGCSVIIHGVPEDERNSLLNGQRGICEKWDSQVGRVFVRINPIESAAFKPQNLRVISEEELETLRPVGTVIPPRGSGGMLLRPGTVVTVYGIVQESWLNGQVGVCERWNVQKGVMSVRLQSGGAPKLIKPKFLRKLRVHDEESMDPEAKRALEIFQGWDEDGDGMMELAEFAKVLSEIGMSQAVVQVFLRDVDKNHDKFVSYDEFLSWALSPVDTSKLRLDRYWPADGSAVVLRGYEKLRDAVAEEAVEHPEHPEEIPDDAELDTQELERLVGPLPPDWPSHGMAAVNNCRVRFPDFPLDKIVQMLAENNFMGGKTIAAIRKTKAKEEDAVRLSVIRRMN